MTTEEKDHKAVALEIYNAAMKMGKDDPPGQATMRRLAGAIGVGKIGIGEDRDDLQSSLISFMQAANAIYPDPNMDYEDVELAAGLVSGVVHPLELTEV